MFKNNEFEGKFFKNDSENLFGKNGGVINALKQREYRPTNNVFESYLDKLEMDKRGDLGKLAVDRREKVITENNKNPLNSPRATIAGGRKTIFK